MFSNTNMSNLSAINPEPDYTAYSLTNCKCNNTHFSRVTKL